MISSSVFDVTVNTFGDFVTEVFSGDDESQKAKLRTMLNQFTKISRKRKPDGQINSIQTKKKRVSDVEKILPPDRLTVNSFSEYCRKQ